MKTFFSCIAVVTELKKEKLRGKMAGKGKTQDEFIITVAVVPT